MRNRSDSSERVCCPQKKKLPKQVIACSNFKDKSLRLYEKSSIVKNKQNDIVEDEVAVP